MSTKTPTPTDDEDDAPDPSELSDDELLEYIADTDTPLASVARRALEADQEDESE